MVKRKGIDVEVKDDSTEVEGEVTIDAVSPEVFMPKKKKVLFYGVPTCDLVVDDIVVAKKGERYEIVKTTVDKYITQDGIELNNKFVLVRN